MPAAAWAAKSGDAVLFTERDELPRCDPPRARRHERPDIYVLGPPDVVSERVERQLRRLGRVRRIAGRGPVENAVAFARYANATFGWGLRDPGHGMVVANTDRTLDAAAGAILSASGKYGPLLLVDDADELPRSLESFLLDIQPGYRFDPVRGVYNHAWLMGDESAISVELQARIDELSEIVRIARTSCDAAYASSRERPGETRPRGAGAPCHGRRHAGAGRAGDAPLRAPDPGPGRATDRRPAAR